VSNLLPAYAGLFAWSFLAATILPLSSEAPLAALVRAHGTMVWPVLVATAGNYLGACTTYWLGRRAARAVGVRGEEADKSGRAARLLARYGQPVLLLSWVPVLGDALVAGAGAVGVPFYGFSIWVVLGKGLRYLAVAWAAAKLWS
jgi:membrane protein YqaA with SNARE-associated domain